jgi:hypothetical protein
MIRKRIVLAVVLFLFPALLSFDALAWGPKGQRSIAVMAMKLISEEHSSLYRAEYLDFERNVLRGCSNGYGILEGVPLRNDGETIQAIGAEIQLLRTARLMNPNSPYFSYRMGVLSTLVADVIQPFGFTWTAREKRLQQMINEDIEKHLAGYRYIPQQKGLTFIRELWDYIYARRAFYESDKEIIFQDYRDGTGYNGFLKKGGPVYFSRAVQSVADVWHTVLREKKDPGEEDASYRALKWYFVKEIKYLLEHDLVVSADESYRIFDGIPIEIGETYVDLGQFYYDYGTKEGIQRGIREWKKAYRTGGPERVEVARKLVSHYLEEGRDHLENYQSQDRTDMDLPKALEAFETALEFENTSDEAAAMIKKTRTLIKEREERFQAIAEIIATATRVREEAEKAYQNEDFSGAIKTYRQAVTLFGAVDNEFREQEKVAREEIRRITAKIDDVINDVLDRASDAIYSEGEKAEKRHEYEAAIAAYERVPGILANIPEDVSPDFMTQKQEFIDLAADKIEKARRAKIRYEKALEQQRQAAQQRGGGQQ